MQQTVPKADRPRAFNDDLIQKSKDATAHQFSPHILVFYIDKMERTEYTGIELAGMNLNDILDNIFGGDYETSMEMRSIAFSSEPINYFHNDNILPGFAFTSGSGSSHSGYCIAITNGAKLNDSISSDMTYNEIADVIGDFDVQAIGGEWSLIHYADIDGYSVAFCVKANDYLKQNMTGGHASRELLRAANPKLKSIGIRTK